MVLSKFFPSSMVFAHIPKTRLPFLPLYTRDVFDDAAEFTLCYGLHLRSPCCLGRYFILPLSTQHYCYAPGLANGLLGNYPYRTCTGECGPASLDAQNNKNPQNHIFCDSAGIYSTCKAVSLYAAQATSLLYILTF